MLDIVLNSPAVQSKVNVTSNDDESEIKVMKNDKKDFKRLIDRKILKTENAKTLVP